MNQYEQDLRTQAENKKKKDDTITKGLLLGGAILGGIALYNATVNNNVPKTTLNSLFDNKLSPNSIETGNNTVVPPVVEPNLETTVVTEQPTGFPYQYNGKVPENMLKYQDNLGASLKYALQDENTRNSNFGLYWKTLPEQFKNDNVTYLNERGFTLPGKEMPLYTKNGSLLANKYDRVVTGQYGSFIEIDPKDFVGETIVAPGQEFRLTPEFKGKYQWYNPTDGSGAKLYKQVNGVRYADYKPNKWYISPFEVTTGEIPAVTTPDLGTQQFNSISFTGHRPKDLPNTLGYDYTNPDWRFIIDKTKDEIRKYNPKQVITGMALGYDQAALLAANELKQEGMPLKIIGEIPFPGAGKGSMSKEQWNKYLNMLDEIHYTSPVYTDNGLYQRRNEKMVDASDLVISLYNGKGYGGTFNDLQYAKKKNVPTVNVYDMYTDWRNNTSDKGTEQMQMQMQMGKVIPYEGVWTREQIANDPNSIYLFGDNYEDMKNGYVPSKTQAVIRGLPNAVGIVTKWNRNDLPNSFLADLDLYNEDWTDHIKEVAQVIKNTLKEGKNVYIPKNNGIWSIGKGKAMLPKKAPRISKELDKFFDTLYNKYK